MKIVHICLSMGYTEGLNYQENVIIKYQARDGHDVSLVTTDHCFHEGQWGLCQTESDYINPDGVHIIRLPFAYHLPYKINKQIGIFRGFYQVLEKIQLVAKFRTAGSVIVSVKYDNGEYEQIGKLEKNTGVHPFYCKVRKSDHVVRYIRFDCVGDVEILTFEQSISSGGTA